MGEINKKYSISKTINDLKENSLGSAGILPEQLEQINTNKTNISTIQTSLNK